MFKNDLKLLIELLKKDQSTIRKKFSEKRIKMSNVAYRTSLAPSDPKKNPVLIIGQLKHLKLVKYSDIKCKLEPRVSEEDYKAALAALPSSYNDGINLYLNHATIARLPQKATRNNTPARSHMITRLIHSHATGVEFGLDEYIVIVCEPQDFYASACAVARAYPAYEKKTTNSMKNIIHYVEFVFISDDHNERNNIDDSTLELITESSYGLRLCRTIVDAPCSYMDVDQFIMEAQAVAEVLGCEVDLIKGDDLRLGGFGGIHGVGKAARCPPALLVLKHNPPGATKNIAWVGKGIVYDTGGLSLKGKFDMPGMKRDCGGAAAILGAFYVAIRSGFTENLYAVFCLAENAVGPDALRPDDIITLYSGKTVEINNSDAEGRLVLADGVVYADKNLKADIIVDVATLTGAQGIATGKYHASIMSNDEEWETHVKKAGLACGELVYPVVFCPELHFNEFSSTVADMKNSVKDRYNAQVSCAGTFIFAHLGFEFPGKWIHIDMAYPVTINDVATGFGVTLLPTLFGKYTKQKVLNMIGPDIEPKQANGAKRQKTN